MVEASGSLNSLPSSGSWNVAGTVNQPGGQAQTFPLGGITLTGGTLTSPANSGNATYGNFCVAANDTLTASGAGNTVNCTNFGIADGGTLTLNTPQTTDTLTASTQFINGNGERHRQFEQVRQRPGCLDWQQHLLRRHDRQRRHAASGQRRAPWAAAG